MRAPSPGPGGDGSSDLAWVVAETAVEGPGRFRHRDRIVDVPPPGLRPAGPADPRVRGSFGTLDEALALHLYREAYCPGRGGGGSPSAGDADADEDLTRLLSAANRGRDRWDDGWVVMTVEPAGHVVAQRGGEQRRLPPGGWVVPGTMGRPGPGSPVRIACLAEATDLQPGFYFAMGGGLADPDPGAELVRLYWNIAPEGAPALVAGITGTLERFCIPFRLKVANRRRLFLRSEPAVLYLHRRHLPAALECLSAVHDSALAHLRHPVPLFTRRLARGLALAEDPLSRDSFGLDRCRLVARAIAGAWAAGIREAPERMAHVRATLEAQGFDPARLYLNPGSCEIHELPPHWRTAA